VYFSVECYNQLIACNSLQIRYLATIGVDLTGILRGEGGTHGGTYYKSPAVEAKKTHFPSL